jgi:uncharacterized protein
MACCRWAILIAFVLFAFATQAQTVEVNQQNRTIELTTTSSIDLNADLVSIEVGYHNWGPTHDAAYDENMRVAEAILKAWTDAGVSQKEISTQELSSNAVSAQDLKEIPPAERKDKQFEATQSWGITAKPEVAQQLIDLAVSAGANVVNDPQWQLSDPSAAEAKAYATALEQAHGLAEQMAKSFGAKVGALLYATNQTRIMMQIASLATVQAETSTAGGRKWPPVHPVKLLPPKIERSATVRAIFALE